MSNVYLKLETQGYPLDESSSIVGISRYSIEELITLIRRFEKSECNYIKLLNGIKDVPIEDNGKFWYDLGFVHRYIFQMSDSFEIWKPYKQAPLLIDHLKQDLRILIAPKIRGE